VAVGRSGNRIIEIIAGEEYSRLATVDIPSKTGFAKGVALGIDFARAYTHLVGNPKKRLIGGLEAAIEIRWEYDNLNTIMSENFDYSVLQAARALIYEVKALLNAATEKTSRIVDPQISNHAGVVSRLRVKLNERMVFSGSTDTGSGLQ
jgi:hypothetical protein